MIFFFDFLRKTGVATTSLASDWLEFNDLFANSSSVSSPQLQSRCSKVDRISRQQFYKMLVELSTGVERNRQLLEALNERFDKTVKQAVNVLSAESSTIMPLSSTEGNNHYVIVCL
jgi:uncharacterized coiled-coil protein SlyX